MTQKVLKISFFDLKSGVLTKTRHFNKITLHINKRVIESDYGMNSLDACIQNINHLVNGEHRENITETVINYLQGTIEHRVRSKSPNSRITQPSQMIHGVYKQNTGWFCKSVTKMAKNG